MSRDKSNILRELLESLNDVIFEKFEDNSELLITISTDGYSDLLKFRGYLLDTENDDLYDDEKLDFEQDGKNLNEMLTGREKALIELSKKFENIRKTSEVVLEYINNELKKKIFKIDVSDMPKKEAEILIRSPLKIMETDLNLPNEFDNKRFQ